MSNEELKTEKKKRSPWKYIFFVILFLALFIFLLVTQFHIETIEITGNVHASDVAIKEAVVGKGYIDNTLIFYLKNKIFKIKGIPFVDKLDIEYASKNKIVVNVYEKAFAGCIKSGDQYAYFDDDGNVMEISSDRMKDVTLITGMNVNELVLNQRLNVGDDECFSTILNLTQLLTKYDLSISKANYSSNGEMTLYVKDIEILIGTDDYLDEKISNLGNILKSVEGKKGTLNMKNFSNEKKDATFITE